MPNNYVSLDIGRARIGVAIANDVARIAAPLPAIQNNKTCMQAIEELVAEHSARTVVVGLPRGLEGQETEQTAYVRDFIAQLQKVIAAPIVTQDEALTSVQAEAELEKRGRAYNKGDIDSLSAVYILEDFLREGVH